MEETNAPIENAVDESAVQQEIQTDQSTEQVETSSDSVTETVEESVDQIVEPATELPEYDITQYLQQESVPEFQADENGYIDPKQFYAQVLRDAEARMEQRLKFQESERKLWSQVENKYPEIKEDSELRDMLNAQRIADVTNGGKGDLNSLADKFIGKLQNYQNKGKAQAQVSEKVQKSASLESSTANNVSSSKDNDLMERMSNGDKNARDQLISEWLSSGKI